MSEFDVGKLIQLKSGGPAMTITEVGHANDKRLLTTKWFEGDKLKTGTFPEDACQPYEGPPGLEIG